jgi:2-C-methyl-D-erythritol 4-phosphate cytidylyltransferase/2-C-methyl-D-erythritol 2,4-cyclodiphosphate synthase
MRSLAILVAAGRGERMGGDRPKAFLELAGQPLLLRSARALARCPEVGGLVAVVPEAEVDVAAEMLAGLEQPCEVTVGGARRQDSVLEGLKCVPDGFDGIVLVHDAARPFVGPDLVGAVVEAAEQVGAALPVLPLHDTIKSLEGGRVVGTLDRSTLGAAQTPQGFRLGPLVEAYEQAFRDRVTLTDEAMAMERLGLPVAAVPGAAHNRKLTTPEDLAWASDRVARGV